MLGFSPEVSVIMPAYNAERTIQQAIESVLIQDVPLELIVIDDGSSDRTKEIVQSMAKDLETKQKDGKHYIVYHKNQKNSGAAASRNTGTAMARAPWVAFLDSDDWWAAGKLKAQLELLSKTGDVLCCTARNLVNHEGKSLDHIIHVKSRITYRDLLKHNSINCSSVVVRTEVMRAFPMTHEDSHEDYISWLQILKKYGSVCGIDRPYLMYRMSQNSKSGSKLKAAKMTYKVYGYMGYGRLQSAAMFISYAIHGIIKYLI